MLPAALLRLAELFQLRDDERRVLALLLSTSEPQPVGQAATALALELMPLLAMLAADSPLRVHGLVEVDAAAELGFLRPGDLLHPGRGLHLVGHAPDAALFSGQAPGVSYLAAPTPGTEWAKDILQDRAFIQGSAAQGAQAAQVSELVRERLIAPHPILLWLSQCQPETVLPLSQAVRLRLQRPVLLLDGAVLSGWPTPQLHAALRRLRRDADLRGAVVVVSEAQLLGGAWVALAAPRPPGQTAPVVLCSSSTFAAQPWLPLSSRGGAELVPQMTALRPAPTAPAAPGAAAAGDPTAEDPATLASREEARRRAALDAARAMGKPIPPELMAAAAASPPPSAGPPLPAAPRPAAPAAPSSPVVPPPITHPAHAPAAAPAATPAPASAPARPTNPRLAAALAKAGLPPAGSARSASTPAASAEPATPAAPAAPSAPPASSPAVAPAASAAADPAEDASAIPSDDSPPLPLADDAGLDELLRVGRTTPNQLQRAEILRKLAGKKSPLVIQLFRANVQSAHPGVRAAAEAGMASLFGANWNRTRAIAPPVQPPRSDDGGRGPGGAF